MKINRLFGRAAVPALLLVLALPASATDSRSADEWKFDAAVYLWAASMDVKPDDGDSIKISFSDILDHLDMTYMGMLGARKGKWSLLADTIYMDLSDSVSGERKLPHIDDTVTGKVDVDMEAWIVTLAGGYNLVDTGKYSLDLLAGARYLSVDVPLKFTLNETERRKTTPSGNLWDGLLGVRGEADLGDNWYMNYYLDAGTGDSSFTWQGLAGLGYHFKQFDAGFGYRYLTWNMNSGDLDDLTVKGPYAGVRFRF